MRGPWRFHFASDHFASAVVMAVLVAVVAVVDAPSSLK